MEYDSSQEKILGQEDLDFVEGGDGEGPYHYSSCLFQLKTSKWFHNAHALLVPLYPDLTVVKRNKMMHEIINNSLVVVFRLGGHAPLLNGRGSKSLGNATVWRPRLFVRTKCP